MSVGLAAIAERPDEGVRRLQRGIGVCEIVEAKIVVAVSSAAVAQTAGRTRNNGTGRKWRYELPS